jgi:hypothetical protein
MNRGHSARKIILLSLIFLSLSFVFASPIREYASTNYTMQSSIQYFFVQGSQPTNSYYQMTVTAWASNPAVIPSHVAVNYWLTYDGNVYYNHGCSLNYSPGQHSNSCTFTVPFKGNGEYTFYATFKDNSGNIVAQSIVDPMIEPEW